MTGEDIGLSISVWNDGLGAAGISSGDSAGEVVESSGDAAVARVFTSTFIPWLQCPIVPQMKYLFPGEVRGMVVAPSL